MLILHCPSKCVKERIGSPIIRFRMRLHADAETGLVAVLHELRDAIVRPPRNNQRAARRCNRLVMPGVHENFVYAKNAVHHTPSADTHRMLPPRFKMVVPIPLADTVFDGAPAIRDMLMKNAACGNRERLRAAADTKNRHAVCKGQTQKRDFQDIPFRRIRDRLGMILVAVQTRINVAPAHAKKAVCSCVRASDHV